MELKYLVGGAGEPIFEKIGSMLEQQKHNISTLKYEYINLLINSYIISFKNNYTSFYENEKIKDENYPFLIILNNLKDNMYDYNILDTINATIVDIDNTDMMKKIAHILNIYHYIYKEIKGKLNTKFNKLNNPDDNRKIVLSKINEILLTEDKEERYRKNFIDNLKNNLMKNIFEYVKNLKNKDTDTELVSNIKTLYNSIQNKKSHMYNILNKIQNITTINDTIDKLNNIKIRYDIYTKYIINADDISENEIFLFNSVYRFLDNENPSITNIKQLKDKINVSTIIVDDQKSSQFSITSRIKSLFKNQEIGNIIQDLKNNIIDIKFNRSNLQSDRQKIRNNTNLNDTEKGKKLSELNNKIQTINKNIITNISALNQKKEILVSAYIKQNNGIDQQIIYKMFNDHFKEELMKDNKVTEEDIESYHIFDDIQEVVEAQPEQPGGKLAAKYKSTGDTVYILYNNKKIKRCVYEKTKGRGKYCKIDKEFKLLSKLKIM